MGGENDSRASRTILSAEAATRPPMDQILEEKYEALMTFRAASHPSVL